MEVSFVPLEGVSPLLPSLCVLVAPTISSMNSFSEKGFNLFLLIYVCEMDLHEGVASSLSLLRFLSSFRGVCTVGGVLMMGYGSHVWVNSFDKFDWSNSSWTWGPSSACCSLCACDSICAWDSYGTYMKEYLSSLLSISISAFSTTTLVLSLSTRVFSTHSNWFAYFSILGILC